MRVIGGTARGRPLKAKLPSTVRPTTDYAREAIFSMLESRGGLYDLVVADLYCGSGAMGIEAMSRGAAKVYFVDDDPACLAAVKLNLEPLGFDGRGRLRARDVAGVVAAGRPRPRPRRSALRTTRPRERVERRRRRRVMVENDRHMEAPEGWIVTKTKRYGTTLVTMLEPDEGGA